MEEVRIFSYTVHYIYEMFAHSIAVSMYYSDMRFSFTATQFVEFDGKVLSFFKTGPNWLKMAFWASPG